MASTDVPIIVFHIDKLRVARGTASEVRDACRARESAREREREREGAQAGVSGKTYIDTRLLWVPSELHEIVNRFGGMTCDGMMRALACVAGASFE